MKTSVLALSMFMGSLALITAPAPAQDSDAQGNEEIVIQNFAQDSDVGDEAETDEVGGVNDQSADNGDQGDDTDDQWYGNPNQVGVLVVGGDGGGGGKDVGGGNGKAGGSDTQ
jgi:hypothetical protein